jgi:tetratricopeptide (TPR) repeat protein
MARRTLLAIVLLVPAFLRAADPGWVQISTPHFSVITDGGDKKGFEVGMRFEQVRSIFGALLQRSTINLPTTQIIAFRNHAAIEQYGDVSKSGSAEASGFVLTAPDRSFIALDLSSADPYGPVLHDFAHVLLGANYPRTQPWFDEGFAEYFSAAQITNKEVMVGGPHESYDRLLNATPWIPFAELATTADKSNSDKSGSRRTMFYAESWAIVHYIFDQHKLPEAANYFDLVENQRTSPSEAVRRAFGMDASTFLKNVQEHYRAGQAAPYRAPTPQSLQPDLYPVKKVLPIDAQGLLADLHAHSVEHREAAKREYEAMLKVDRNNVVANRGLGYLALQKKDLTSADRYFKDALAMHAQDPALLYYAALLLTLRPDPNNVHRSDPALMETYLVGATNLDPNFAEAWSLLAYSRRKQDKLDLAIDAAVNAVKLQPRSEDYQRKLAQLYVDARQWDNAKYVYTALRSSRNEETARNAEAMLTAIEHAKDTGGKIASPSSEGAKPTAEASPDEGVIDHGDKPANAPEEKPDTRPVKFIRATLAGVSCDGKSAVLNLALAAAPAKGAKSAHVRMLKMLVPDIQQVILVGVDSFSCDWRNQKVALNYKEGASPSVVANAKSYDGDVVSIEMH